ncbi:MAG TPA: helix-turn-helix domain-containing protein [Chloroflexota bacterium]|nr:helix-turn-helix domain-containing protein [Chloroflexota bacterium]
MMERNNGLPRDGQVAYQRWRDKLLSTEEGRQVYEEEAAKSELWLQLVEARIAAGLTQAELAKRLGVSQAQVARIEKRGYDAYTLNTLRRYVKALGEGFDLEVNVKQRRPEESHPVLSRQ